MKNSMKATVLIKQDHRAVEKLYKEYKTAEGNETERDRLALNICKSLDMHAKMEEKYFYPALQKEAGQELKIIEAYAEHLGTKALVKAVKSIPEGRVRSGMLDSLMSLVKHHVREEEREMLPEAEKLLGEEKLLALGAKMAPLSPSEKDKEGW